MGVQSFLVERFSCWRPPAPTVVARNKGDITLSWTEEQPFSFLGDQLLYRLEKSNKMPRWLLVYSGGKTTKMIDNLAPRTPHKFRLKVILKATAVPRLAELALAHFGDEQTVYNEINHIISTTDEDKSLKVDDKSRGDYNDSPNPKYDQEAAKEESKTLTEGYLNVDNDGTHIQDQDGNLEKSGLNAERGGVLPAPARAWLESRWSEETWTSTDTDGSSPVCFCMAVRCGYLRQVQVMLDERPALIGIINPSNGFTPLAVAVRKGDINTVKFLVGAGADIEQPSATGQRPLHLALLAANMPIAELLMDKGADIRAGDRNGLRAEHYAVESGAVAALRLVLARGGELRARDHSGWTPLFRAVCQGADTEMIEELVMRGSDVDARDHAGLPLANVARLLHNRHGRGRDSVLRLVDSHYPHEKALENFTRLTKKIYNVHSLLKLA